MVYKINDLPLAELIGPVAAVTAALSRLDERLARSQVKDGWMGRSQFFDACASLWLDGELVHIEDLVLHDGRMDVRAPTHELTQAHAVLRTRRLMLANKPNWALSVEGLRSLRGGRTITTGAQMLAPTVKSFSTVENGEQESASSLALTRQLAAMDELLQRTESVLGNIKQGSVEQGKAISSPSIVSLTVSSQSDLNVHRDPLVYEEEWDEEAKFAEWSSTLEQTRDLPPVLRAVLALDAWREIRPLQRAPWFGRLFSAALLRESGLTSGHLIAINTGLKVIPRERRTAPDRTVRLLALADALAQTAVLGFKEHDRLVLGREAMQRKLKGKRSNSKLPQLIDLVLSRPLVTSTLIEKELKISLQGALNLVAELELREITGRGRYRAWGLL